MEVRSIRRHAPVLLVLLGSLLVADTVCSDAGSEKPKEASITFGAEKKPSVRTGKEVARFATVFADVAEKVVPSVVSVIPTKVDTLVFRNNPFYHFFGDPFSQDSPFDFFFNPPRRRNRPRQKEPQIEKREYRQKGLGSGVIVSHQGHILTNFHVVKGADEIEVKLNDERVFEAEIVGSDSLSDVAVIKIAGDIDGLPVAYLGNSDKLRPGDWVIAVGNPFSLASTVTAGIVSALGRAVGGANRYQNFIQTDAAINPGNSGGALVNIRGELVGINTMIYSRSGGYMGIGFAIPVNMAKRIMEDLVYRGEVVRGWLGVGIQDIDPATRDVLGLDNAKGVLISDVYKGDPADKAGVKTGDVVVSVDGRRVDNANELRNMVALIRPGEMVTVGVLRDGKKKTLKVKMGRRDEGRIEKLAKKGDEAGGDAGAEDKKTVEEKIGIKVANITPELREKYGIDRGVEGVVVLHVDRALVDARGGLKEGDVIKAVKMQGSGFTAVRGVKDFRNATAKLKEGDAIMLRVERDGHSFFTAFKVRK
ncbi:MAG: Do family serine endopeptidase [Chitinivibrionales bacterium]|nr:Do family serine endopeptidase [Chitinivibrionales bacterium]MBD3395305.1 Do family serine endopeptidase [Chitinivibrionales bacterium]